MAHIIDAQNQSLGRLASRLSVLLRGKDKPGFTPNIMSREMVEVKNASKIKFTGQKLKQKIYYRYSGYHGGIRAQTLGKRMEEDPKNVLWQTVYRMMPQNRQRSQLMKHLIIHD